MIAENEFKTGWDETTGYATPMIDSNTTSIVHVIVVTSSMSYSSSSPTVLPTHFCEWQAAWAEERPFRETPAQYTSIQLRKALKQHVFLPLPKQPESTYG
jgi:hypothetical protein